MSRRAWVRTAEIVLVLPATLFLAPMAGFTAMGMMFAIAEDAHLGSRADLMVVAVMLSFLAAVVGLASLWTAMVLPLQPFARTRTLRGVVLLGIVTGIIDAFYWLWTIAHQPGIHETSHGFSAWSVWLLMLAGPIVIGFVHALRLAFIRGA